MRIEEVKTSNGVFYGTAMSRRGRRYKWYRMVDMFDVTRHEPCGDRELWSNGHAYRRPDGSKGWREIGVPGLRAAVEKTIRDRMN